MTDLLVVGKKMAPTVSIVDTGAASTRATLAAKVVFAIHIASGGGSTHASPSSSNVTGFLQNQRLVRHKCHHN